MYHFHHFFNILFVTYIYAILNDQLVANWFIKRSSLPLSSVSASVEIGMDAHRSRGLRKSEFYLKLKRNRLSRTLKDSWYLRHYKRSLPLGSVPESVEGFGLRKIVFYLRLKGNQLSRTLKAGGDVFALILRCTAANRCFSAPVHFNISIILLITLSVGQLWTSSLRPSGLMLMRRMDVNRCFSTPVHFNISIILLIILSVGRLWTSHSQKTQFLGYSLVLWLWLYYG